MATLARYRASAVLKLPWGPNTSPISPCDRERFPLPDGIAGKRVEPVELHRVYPAVAELSAGSDVPRRHAALDAEIEAVITRAGNLLRQQLDEVRRAGDVDQRERRPWRAPAKIMKVTHDPINVK